MDLGAKISRCVVGAADGKEFVPNDIINELTARGAVKDYLGTNCRHLPKGASVDSLVAYVTNRLNPAKRVFLTLVFCGHLEYLSVLQKAGFYDTDLPIESKWDTIKERYDVYTQSAVQVQLEANHRKLWGSFHDWTTGTHVESFEDKQWYFMAPVFVADMFNYRLLPKCPLPIVTKYFSELQERGYSGLVSTVTIHEAHIQAGYRGKEITSEEMHPNMEDYYAKESHCLRIIYDLKNPHFIQPLAAYTRGDQYEFLFPSTKHENLIQFWRTKHLPKGEPQIRWVLNQLCGLSGAIEALRRENCCIINLEPKNILLFPEDETFGMLRIVHLSLVQTQIDEATQCEQARIINIGNEVSTRYESPEWGLSDVPDVWGLGCVFFEFLVWTIYGPRKVAEFLDRDLQFWQRDKRRSPGGDRQHPQVERLIEIMRTDLNNDGAKNALKDCLELVAKRMLVPDDEYRADAKEVHSEMQRIRDRSLRDKSYLSNNGIQAAKRENTADTHHNLTQAYEDKDLYDLPSVPAGRYESNSGSTTLQEGEYGQKDVPETFQRSPSDCLLSTEQEAESSPALSEHTANHTAAIRDVLRLQSSVEELAIYLEKRFSEVASGAYAWLSDVRDMNYSYTGMAKLLYEDFHDSHWIYFDSMDTPPTKSASIPLKPNFHISGCVHQFSSKGLLARPLRIPKTWPNDDNEVKREVENLCGICGIVPASRETSKWNGSVEMNDGSVATVSHAIVQDGIENIRDISTRLLRVTESLEAAAAVLQDAGFCCQSFTVLVAKDLRLEPPQVGIQCFELSVFSSIAKHLRILQLESDMEGTNDTDLQNAWSSLGLLCHMVLRKVSASVGNFVIPKPHDGRNPLLHSMSLSIQVLGLGLLSYAQAHAGGIRPFFLATTLEQIQLVGLEDPASVSPEFNMGVTACLTQLTCLDGMVKDKVMVFYPSTMRPDTGTRFDVCAKLEDVLDTWGPGRVVVEQDEAQLPVAIEIGGGLIVPVVTDTEIAKCHWGSIMALRSNSFRLDLRNEVIIGTLILRNPKCTNNEGKCWKNAQHQLEPLGTHGEYTEAVGLEASIQGGFEGLTFVFTHVRGKKPRVTVKDSYFAKLGKFEDSEPIISFLDDYSAVRVSHCTGVAQRVPLRQMVGDLFPVFAKACIKRADLQVWHSLKDDIEERFNAENATVKTITCWFTTMDETSQNFVLRIMRLIFFTLMDTGISPCGQYLSVAWPYDSTIHKGFQVPVSNDFTKWASILAETEKCATFAYVTHTCLETSEIRCRKPDPDLTDGILLFETPVICQALKVSPQWALCHQKNYYFNRAGKLPYWVTVEKDGSQSAKPTTLVGLRSFETMAPTLKNRMMEIMKGAERRIQEAKSPHRPAETVHILSKRGT